jgi:hypothetical protein
MKYEDRGWIRIMKIGHGLGTRFLEFTKILNYS